MNFFLKSVSVIFISSISLSSCSLQNEVIRNQEAKNPSLNAHATGVVLKPIVADLDISKEKKIIIYKADLRLAMSDLKANATRVFLETHKCDYIIDPQFVRTTISSNGLVKEVEYVLSGFTANYTKIYQVDNLPKSVIEYAQIQLPVERVEFSTLNERYIKGSSIGMEFASGFNFAGAQIDFAPFKSGWRFYVGLENYFIADGAKWGDVTFDELINNKTVSQKASNSTMTTFSIGTFKEKEVGRRVKIRGSAGLNLLDIQFFESLADATNKTSYDGARSIGFRLGAAVDYSIFPGFSLIGRAHSNFGLLNSIKQSGVNTSDIEGIEFEDIPLVNFSLGARFTF